VILLNSTFINKVLHLRPDSAMMGLTKKNLVITIIKFYVSTFSG